MCVEDLKKLPASKVAIKYYTEGDMYLFGEFCLRYLHFYIQMKVWVNKKLAFLLDEFQTSRAPNTRRPVIGKVIVFLFEFLPLQY